MKVRFGVSVISGTAFPHRRELDKFAELIRIIDGSGVELIGINDTVPDAYVGKIAAMIREGCSNADILAFLQWVQEVHKALPQGMSTQDVGRRRLC